MIRKSHAWFSRRGEKTLKSDKISPSENNYYVGGGEERVGGERGGCLVMYLIRRYHVVNNNYSRSLFPYSHSFFWGLFLDASEWLQRRCEWRHFTAQILLKLGDPRWRFVSSFPHPPQPPPTFSAFFFFFFPFHFSAILGCPRFQRMKRFCWLLLLLWRLFAGELLATSQILSFFSRSAIFLKQFLLPSRKKKSQ